MKNKLRLKATLRQRGNFRAEGNEIMLYGVIGSYYDDLDGKKVVDAIKAMKGDISVRVNSPGGDVFDGIAIANALREHDGKVTVHVDALAASIASIIAMAGSEIVMCDGSFLMIHNPWTVAMGDASEFRKSAAILDKVAESMADIYAKKTGMERKDVFSLMDAETWFTAEEAVAAKFADFAGEAPSEEETALAALAEFDLSVFDRVPESLKIAAKANKPQTVRELEKVLHNIGFSRAEAKAVASAGLAALERRDAGSDEDSARLLAALENRKKAMQGV
jgi:ATP-dependent Clp protease, protease subunit